MVPTSTNASKISPTPKKKKGVGNKINPPNIYSADSDPNPNRVLIGILFNYLTMI
jgi:hypothetical protein